MRLLYTVLLYLLSPLLLARLWWRGRLAPAYRQRWGERLGFYWRPRLSESVWIHAVSVGEALAAAPMIRELLARYPQTRLVITTTTPTGSEQVRKLFADRVEHVYCPWDLPDVLARFFRVFNPRLLLVMETELWPNMLAAAHSRGVPSVLVNGRLSEKSWRSYGRVRALATPMLSRLTLVLAQTEVEGERFIDLGVRPQAMLATGSIKFDIDIDNALREKAAALREQFAGRPVWLAASTHPGEDQPVLAAHRQLLGGRPDALLVLVPRHPERFAEVANRVRDEHMTLARRSLDEAVTEQTQVYLADTMGELMMLFGACDLAFVAGSLVPVGGHNLLEPAAWGKPVLSGPQLHNFERIAGLLDDAGALILVRDSDQLASAVNALLADEQRRCMSGDAARGVVAQHRGALARVLDQVAALWP